MKHYKNADSLLKLVSYVGAVAKEPILIDGAPYGYLPPLSVTISESFYAEDSCIMCGKCCLNNTQAWTQEGINQMDEVTDKHFAAFDLDFEAVNALKSELEESALNVNGKDIKFWTCEQLKKSEAFKLSWEDRGPSPRCKWLFEKDGTYRCRIHPIRPLTCGLPHLRFIQMEKTRHTIIRTAQYGRNFRLKCPITFTRVSEESVQTKIYWLKRLLACANDLGIDTFLPEIIQYLESGGRHEVTFTLDSKRKLF